jgi:hypothetical protein
MNLAILLVKPLGAGERRRVGLKVSPFCPDMKNGFIDLVEI